MSSNNYIVLLDPSLQNNEGEPSGNLGDLIIYDFIKDILYRLFPDKEMIRISTHVPFTKKSKELINNSLYTFVGGTNILTSDIRNFPRLTPVKRKGFYFFPGFKKVILLGTGWSSYQHNRDWATRFYYKNILHKQALHSVRDIYSEQQLEKAGFKNLLHTSCPSTWQLNSDFVNQYNPAHKNILFTLSSYYPHQQEDDQLVETILSAPSEKYYFFPQTKEDTDYLASLPCYQKNKSKISLLHHDIREFLALSASGDLNYIGNRLHGGIRCLAFNNPSLIISVDNRATEMGKSINLNVVERNNIEQVRKWISKEYIPAALQLPKENIKRWQDQFKQSS